MTPAATSPTPDTPATANAGAASVPCRSGGLRPAGRAFVGSVAGLRCPTARALAAGVPWPLRTTTTAAAAIGAAGPDRSVTVRCADDGHGGYGRLPRLGPTRLDDPGDLIAAVPAMLGFCPYRSLVLAVLCATPETYHNAAIDLVVRFDLPSPACRQSNDDTAVAAAVARVCARPGVLGVLVVLVDEEPGNPRGSVSPPIPVLTELERRLAAAAVPVQAVWAVRTIAAGERWWNVHDAAEHGVVADPAASAVTLSRVLDGRPVRHSRTELTGLIAADAALCAEVGAELGPAKARAKGRYAAAARKADPAGFLRTELGSVLWFLAHTESGAELAARELADIAVALRDRELRDSMFALAATGHAEAAEQLWIRLTRALHGADRAETATLLGYFAYVRGDGPMAGIALDAALAADPHHAMAGLLHAALEAGMRPERLRDLARCGQQTAAVLGVNLDGAAW